MSDWIERIMIGMLKIPVRYWGAVMVSPGLRMSWKNKNSIIKKPTMSVISITFLISLFYTPI
jgi:hypothetical protein